MSKRLKQYLMLLAAVGVLAVALGGGSGTFAGFNAEVANQGNYFKTGTLFLHDTTNGVTCTSESAAGNTNIGTGDSCATIFSATLASGTSTTYYEVTLKNAGTLDASGISFYTNGCTPSSDQTLTNGSLSANATGSNQTSLSVTGLTYGMPAGTVITVGSQTFTTAAAVGPGANTITINSANITGTINSGSAITFQPSFGSGNLCTGLDVGIVEVPTASSLIGAAVGCAYGDNSTNPVCNLTSSYNLNNLPSNPSSPQALTLTAGGGSGNGVSSTGLDSGGSRYFLIAVKPDSNFGNTYQNKKATVDLVWHIDQA